MLNNSCLNQSSLTAKRLVSCQPLLKTAMFPNTLADKENYNKRLPMEKQNFSLKLSRGCYLAFLYCLPALIVLALLLGNYYNRVGQVANYIEEQRISVIDAKSTLAEQGQSGIAELRKYFNIELSLDGTTGSAIVRQLDNSDQNALRDYYIRLYGENGAETPIGNLQQIQNKLTDIWIGNALLITVMALIPFMMLGGRFAFSHELKLNYEEKLRLVSSGWWMKLVVAFVIVYGWVYIINPQGRGASTVIQFLISVDLAQTDTLPMFLRNVDITPIIAGFLGWYLYLITYFFSKMTSNDVVSAQAYGTLLQKFLFTWGVTIVFIATQVGDNANIMAFLIGYFPMAAFSVIKDKGMSLLQSNPQQEKGQLSELPGISRWQILRLEEEGIDSLGALAYRDRESLNQYMPSMAKLVDYWADIARLYAIAGQASYVQLQQHCLSASEFVRRAEDPEFVQEVASVGITNVSELARLLKRTFPDLEQQAA